jgi:hypothetical protein
MKTILNQADKHEIFDRLDSLTQRQKPLWGKMNSIEMLCHCADQIRVALNEIKIPIRSSFLSRFLLGNLVLWGLPAPKGKVKTFSEIDQSLNNGTKSLGFEEDKKLLKKVIEEFLLKDEGYSFQAHAVFGPFNRKKWGRIIFIHLDHHFKQFGI